MKKLNTIVFFIFCSLMSVKSDGFPYDIPLISESSVTPIPYSGENASISMPYSPVTNDVATITYTFSDIQGRAATELPVAVAVFDTITVCSAAGTSATLQPLQNDIGYCINGSGGVSAGSKYLNLASFTYQAPSGVVISNGGRDATTRNAKYSYNPLTGMLTLTTTTYIESGTKEIIAYSVGNQNDARFSIPAYIVVIFSQEECVLPTLPVASAGTVNIPNTCSKVGSKYNFDILKNSMGYSIVNKEVVSGTQYLDKTTFRFTDSQGGAINNTTPYEMTTKYAKYTYDPTTGYVHTEVLANDISGKQDESDIYFTIRNLGSTDVSNVGLVAITYDSTVCRATNVWIKINSQRKGFFINGMGGFVPIKS